MQPLNTPGFVQDRLWRLAAGMYFFVIACVEFPVRHFHLGHPGVRPVTFFPEFYSQIWGPNLITTTYLLLMISSLALAAGFSPRMSASLIFFAQLLIMNRWPGATTPELNLLCWLLVARALAPRGTGITWKYPRELQWAAWIVVSVSYTHSVFSKLRSPSTPWLDGTALAFVFENQLSARSWTLAIFQATPNELWTIATYSTLIIEGLPLLALFGQNLRQLWNLFAIFLHLGILLLMDLTAVSLGMLLIHFWLIDTSWPPITNFVRRIHSGTPAWR